MRLSTLTDGAMVRQFPEYITLREQLKYSDPDWRPIIPEWDEINIKLLGVAVHDAMTGKKTAAKALQDVAPRVTDLMTNAGYIKS